MFIFGNTKLLINKTQNNEEKEQYSEELEAHMKYLVGEWGQGNAIPGYQK